MHRHFRPSALVPFAGRDILGGRMTNEDRDLLQRLRAEEEDLRRALAQIGARLDELESRAGANGWRCRRCPRPCRAIGSSRHRSRPSGAAAGARPHPPRTSCLPPPAPVLPQIPAAELPPVPTDTTHTHFEFRLGRWLTRLGALFFVLCADLGSTLISICTGSWAARASWG